jgi:hypothetical protein
MKAQKFDLVRYDASEGCTFDWKEPHFIEDENGEKVQEHLNAKTLFIGGNDSISNYVEVGEDGSITELSGTESGGEDEITAEEFYQIMEEIV